MGGPQRAARPLVVALPTLQPMTTAADLADSTATNTRVLVVEDDVGIAASLVRALESQGYAVEHAATGTKAKALARANLPRLVLLDLGLPDSDGLDVCRSLIAEHPGLRVLVLTARVEEIDVVLGLEAGAIDYVTTPCRLAELLARVRSQVRVTPLPAGTLDDRIEIGELVIDSASRRVWLSDAEVELRAKEFDLLHELARSTGRVLTREDLMSRVWDEHWFGSTKTLDVHIASLRRKLGESGKDDVENSNGYISTLRGVGYRLDAPSARVG